MKDWFKFNPELSIDIEGLMIGRKVTLNFNP